MNFIRHTRKLLKSWNCYSTTIVSTPLMLEHLTSRTLIRIQGNEVISFMQGLITNDMNHLTRGSAGMYTMFLNKPGRVLYDSMIFKTNEENTYLIECDKAIVNDLKKHLQMFRVRRKISIDTIDDELKVWVAFDHPTLNSTESKEKNILKVDETKDILICVDPRLKDLGTRIIAPNSYDKSQISNMLNKTFDKSLESEYRKLRYKLGIGEGITDLPPGKCFPLESNCDYLHGVSFHKGCYVGQEFTARTHHTGVIRKRLMPLEFSDILLDINNENKIETSDGKSVGVLRGFEKEFGLTLIKVDAALADDSSLVIGNVKCKTKRPHWWPQEAPHFRDKSPPKTNN